MSSSSTKICFNPDCKDSKFGRLRKGWRLRTGDLAELCDRCASAYEEGRLCEMFHRDTAGWRNCESCRKPLHCGCIVSVHAFVLLDAGGVECMACARKNLTIASSHIWPPSMFLSLPLSQRQKEFPTKNGNPIAGPNAVARKWWEPPNMRNTATFQSELHARIPYEVDRSNGIDKLIAGARPSTSSLEKKKYEDPYERVMSSSLEIAAPDRHANGNSGDDMMAALNTFHREETTFDRLQGSCCLSGENDLVNTRKGVIAEPGLSTSVAVMAYDMHPNSCINISLQSSTSKDDRSTPHFGLAVPCTSPNETNDPTRVSGTQSQQQTPPPPLAKQFYASPHNGVDSSCETQMRNGRPRGDARGRNQLLPRYWPRITDQELQQISGDSNSVITPLFEKMLSASDAGRIGRLVLPKKCAEAYFPRISQPEGLPLKIQDAKGKEWVFQFRFWPNNNSRMYVLEGVTPCIQSMQLQAGDTVTFSRINPEGKLVMGFRKASSSVPPSDQDNRTLKTGNSVSTNAEVNATDPAITWSKVDKSGYMAKDVPGTKSSFVPSKRKSSTLGSKGKRLRIENEDLIELKLSWEAAQGLLRPPPNYVPSIVVIEGHEFEEYEEAPILGKPTIFTTNNFGEKIQWAQCEDCSKWRKLPVDALLPSRWTCSGNLWDPKRSSCSSDQELTADQLNSMLSSSNTAASKKTKSAKKELHAVEDSEGLDTLANLANLAILGEGEPLTPSAQPTTKHPRHRPGCTCIVCIQPPSGKGPKHRDTCTCNVCSTVKRRFRTLMERRSKRQSEKEAETTHKQQQHPEKPEREDDLNRKILINGIVDDDSNKKKLTSPFKGRIDLNIQPEREEESSPVSDSDNITRLLRNATELYLRQQRLASLAINREPIIDQIESGGGGAGGNKLDGGGPNGGDHLDVDMDRPVTVPISMSASTSANG